MARLRLGILRKRPLWFPTWKGWLVLLGLFIGFTFWFVGRIHSFLNVEEPAAGADVLIVEGWVPDQVIEEAVRLFNDPASPYRRICTTGIPLQKGSMFSEFENYGQFAAERLKKLGVPGVAIIVAKAPGGARHRTWNTAVEAREALAGVSTLEGADILTYGVHGRRTLMVYRKAFRDHATVGVRAISPEADYDTKHWWRSSAGMKSVLLETIACTHEWLADSGRN